MLFGDISARISGVEGLIDSFEDEDMSEYTGVGSRTGSLPTTTTTAAIDGSVSLAPGGSDKYAVSYPGDGLDNYPTDGDIISGYLYEDSGNTGQPFYGWYATDQGDNSDWYSLQISGDTRSQSNIQLRRWDDASSTLLADSNPSMSVDTWYLVETKIDGSTFICRVFSVDQTTGEKTGIIDQISASDTNYSGSGWIVGNRNPNGSGKVDGGTLVTDLTIDSFEDESLSEWGNEVANYTTTTSNAADGSVSVTVSTSGSYEDAGSLVGDGLGNYVHQGDTIRFNQYHSQATSTNYTQAGVFFAMYDRNLTNGSYGLRIDPEQTRVLLRKWNTDGTNTNLSADNVTIPYDEWIEAEVSWALDDTLSYTVWDAAGNVITSGSATDTDHSGNNGTIGMRMSRETTNDTLLQDHIREV